mgnify:CR=1 FL=1
MKFFIDTANLNDIAEAEALGVLDGVTTNPSLMAKEGITGEENILNHYKKICDIICEGAERDKLRRAVSDEGHRVPQGGAEAGLFGRLLGRSGERVGLYPW